MKGVPSFLSFLSYFKTLSVGPALGIEPAISLPLCSQALYRLILSSESFRSR